MIIFIDESGTLPDKADKHIVVAALVSYNPEELKNILPKFRKKIPTKGSRRREKILRELKFHYVGDITRRKVLKEIISKNIKIYALVVDKIGRKITDKPENYGKLIKTLVDYFKEREDIKEIYIDKHFAAKETTNKLQSILEGNIKGDFKFSQIDSMEDSRIDLADFVAGAIFRKYRVSDPKFYDIIVPKIVKEEVRKWNEL